MDPTDPRKEALALAVQVEESFDGFEIDRVIGRAGVFLMFLDADRAAMAKTAQAAVDAKSQKV